MSNELLHQTQAGILFGRDHLPESTSLDGPNWKQNMAPASATSHIEESPISYANEEGYQTFWKTARAGGEDAIAKARAAAMDNMHPDLVKAAGPTLASELLKSADKLARAELDPTVATVIGQVPDIRDEPPLLRTRSGEEIFSAAPLVKSAPVDRGSRPSTFEEFLAQAEKRKGLPEKMLNIIQNLRAAYAKPSRETWQRASASLFNRV